ncbi:MAG: hypothetical protein HQ581_21870 [Planctomycetes bacterium]|nr:hypothetical protein [Planctomycetota bacterium]
MDRRTTMLILPITAMVVATLGCDSDHRVTEVATDAAQRQAEQNEIIATQAGQVTETTRQFVESSSDTRKDMLELHRQLVESEAKAREELLLIQQDLIDRDAQCRQELDAMRQETQAAMDNERRNVDRQRENLDAERKEIAGQKQRAPIIAAAIAQVGLILACLLPLVLCGYLLYVLRHPGDNDAAVTELLIEEIVADRPRLLPAPGAMPAIAKERPVRSIEHGPDTEGAEQLESPTPVA